jgi:hypothetical protein
MVVQYGAIFGMEMIADSPPSVADQRRHRSSVSNGSRLFAIQGADARTHTGRRFRDLVEQMTADLGGTDLLSEFQRQLIRRAATLSVMAEAIEADVVRDRDFDILDYGTVCDRLRRIAETLGLRRIPRNVDISPMERLKQYQEAKAKRVIDVG